MKPNLTGSLNAFSNDTRMEIIRLLAEHANSLSFTKLLEEIGYENKNSSNLANHLKKLVELGIVEKDTSFYTLTKLGRQLYDQIDTIEKIIEEHNRDIMVRTSDFCFEPFDETKIAENLIREANFKKEEAYELARIAKRKILNANIGYLTAPLIREYMNFILLESGKEEARHKLTRLGLPPYDVKQLLDNGNFQNSTMLYNELGKNIMEQFLLLTLLPQRFADFYLSGKIFFLHPESWGLNPLEVVISGKRFSKILFTLCKEYESHSNYSENTLNQYLPLVIKNVVDNLKNFFSGGVVITEFERVIKDLSGYFNQSKKNVLELLLEMIPSVSVQYSHDKRNIHSRTWEIWFEVDLHNIVSMNEEIELILTKYYEDIEELKQEKNPIKLISKPNLLINLSSEFKSLYIETDVYRNLPEIQKRLLQIARVHNCSFINTPLTKQGGYQKYVLTPHLNPVQMTSIDDSVLILDKIYVNLPKIIQISENLLNSKKSIEYCVSNGDIEGENDKNNFKAHNKDQKKFLDTLNEWICYAINIFEEKMEILSRNVSKLTNWSNLSKLLFEDDLFEKPTDLVDYKGTTPIVCSVCLNGLKETVQYFTRFPPEKTKDSFQFLIDVITSVANTLKNNTKQEKVSYVLSQTHLDNYLKVRYNQDSVLLKYIEETLTSKDEEEHYENLNLPVYHYSIFSEHNIKGIKKLAHNFKSYQKNMNLAFLNVFIRKKLTKMQFYDAFKIILKNQIHSFGFSRIISAPNEMFTRYAGPYKPLSYYDKEIQNLIKEISLNNTS